MQVRRSEPQARSNHVSHRHSMTPYHISIPTTVEHPGYLGLVEFGYTFLIITFATCHLFQTRVPNVVCHSLVNDEWAFEVQFNGIIGILFVSAPQFCTIDHLTSVLPSTSQGAATNMKNICYISRYNLQGLPMRLLISAFGCNTFHYVTG